jgi:hypothetical protein
MGRKKLNRTKEELKEQSNIRSKRYYQRNKEECDRKRMERYWKQKDTSKTLFKM